MQDMFSQELNQLQADLNKANLSPFAHSRVTKALAEGNLGRAALLLNLPSPEPQPSLVPGNILRSPETPSKAPGSLDTLPASKAPSAGLLLAQAVRGSLKRCHPLEAPEENDPRWIACKRKAVNRIKLHSGNKLPFSSYNPKHGKGAGPGAFVALFLSLMLFYRNSEAERRFSTFACQWAVADILGVSTDTIQKWQKLPEVEAWLQSWRWLDPAAEYKRAGMFYTVLYSPAYSHKKPRGDLLRLPWRSLKRDTADGVTQVQMHNEERIQKPNPKNQLKDPERLHSTPSLKVRWNLLIPVNKDSLSLLGEIKDLVGYVAALNVPHRSKRLEWVNQLVEAFAQHLGLGDDPKTRTKLYYKIAMVCLKAMTYAEPGTVFASVQMVKKALSNTLIAHNKFFLVNPGAYFTKCLKKDGFFDLAVGASLQL
jgi:hypothetical protein